MNITEVNNEWKGHASHSDQEENQPKLHNTGVAHAHLYREDSHNHVIERLLVPKPTNDPRDPLTWSRIRKHMAFIIMSFFVFLSNFTSASITPGLLDIIVAFNINSTQASWLITLQLLMLGLGNLIWIPLAQKIGKRPVCVASSAMFFGACIWSSVAQSYGSLLGSRILQGFAASSSEALGPAVIADIYFLHERGTMVGIYTFMIATGAALGGVFAGFAVNASGQWRWAFWMDAILTGVCFVLMALFQPETNFLRPAESEIGELSHTDTHVKSNYNFVSGLSLWSWYDRETSIWTYLWRPIKVLPYPSIIWASVLYGIVLGWAVVQQSANAVAFPEIYGFTSLGVGNINIANVIGSVIGCLIGGPFSDWIVARIAKHQQGVFRPESRLYLLVIPIIFGPIGLLLWGGGLQNRLHWSVPIAGTGITYAVLCVAPAIVITYVVDCYRPFAGEALTGMTAFKNTFAFGLSFGVTPWIKGSGYLKVGGYNTLIEVVFFLSAVPMYIYGEQLRNWTLNVANAPDTNEQPAPTIVE